MGDALAVERGHSEVCEAGKDCIGEKGKLLIKLGIDQRLEEWKVGRLEVLWKVMLDSPDSA